MAGWVRHGLSGSPQGLRPRTTRSERPLLASARSRESTSRRRLGKKRGSGAAGQPRFVDLSHTVEHGMTTYPGLPGPIICDFLSREASRDHYAPGVEFQIGKIEMVANTGTYLDSPFHRFSHGNDLSQLPLESLADLIGVVVHVSPEPGRAISAQVFDGLDVEGKAVLVHTGWDAH